MNNKPSYVSREGLEKLRQELDTMIDVRRPEVAARIQEAKEHGDITENAEYEDAKNEQAFIEGRIQCARGAHQERHHHRRAPRPRTTSRSARPWTSRSGDGKETYTIVGSAEAAPAQGRISNESPRRAGPARPQEAGDKRHGDRPGRRPSCTRSPASAERHGRPDDVLGRRAGGRRQRAPRSSTTPRPRPAPSTWAACAGVVLHDAIARALRDARPRRRASGTASTTSTPWTPRRS